MTTQNTIKTTPNIIEILAQILGTELVNGRLEIPEQFGKGYCKVYVFNENIRLIISNYELYQNIEINNPEINADKRLIFFKFKNIFPKSQIISKESPSVLIATSSINTDEVISIHSNTSVINIEVNSNYLTELFNLTKQSTILKSLLQNTQPLLFEQVIYPSLQRIVDEILNDSINETFELFFQRIKAEELICRLLIELEKRDEKQLYSLNTRDIQSIYKVKEKILENIETPPHIKEFGTFANMSTSKLNRLFKQIFGNSIFNYYQGFRMEEAARSLKEEKLTVSDVGYKLGFTNLSHFSRVFKEHHGINPKQYSRLNS